MKHRTISLLLVTLALLSIYSCAKEGFPSGGPKDEIPPKPLGTLPMNGSTQFASKEYSIAFDEYVTIKDADNNILVSPPMKHKPEYTTKGRSVVVRIKDTLLENTTYLFQFKGGIVDFNEGNVLESFEYVFSTGSAIDSMSIRGQVLDAFTLKPRTEVVTVIAYSEDQIARFDSLRHAQDSTLTEAYKPDSIVVNVQPMYLTHCNKDGSFELNHIRQGRYLLIALEDADKNLRYNGDEAVAFLDTLVLAQHMPAPIDTTSQDSTLATTDSLKGDSTMADTLAMVAPKYPAITPIALHMSLFKKEVQRVVKADFKRRGQLEIATSCPLSSQFELRPLDTTSNISLHIRPCSTRDTLTVWTSDKQCQSIALLLTDTNLNDTLKLQFQSKSSGPSKLGTKSLISKVSSRHPYYDTLWITFDNPVIRLADSINDSLIRITDMVDTTISYCGLQLTDTCIHGGFWRAMIDFQGKSGNKYQFHIPAKKFYNIYKELNTDSLNITTEYTKAEDYGNIMLSVSYSDSVPALIELTTQEGKHVQHRIITHDEVITFAHLKAGKYGIRAIKDRNMDGSWTPGSYYLHRQPEEVTYFEKILDLRANWDMEERWGVE